MTLVPDDPAQATSDHGWDFITHADFLRDKSAFLEAEVNRRTREVAAIQDVTLRLREDVASEPDQREANQKSAPAVERGLFLVPKVIE